MQVSESEKYPDKTLESLGTLIIISHLYCIYIIFHLSSNRAYYIDV